MPSRWDPRPRAQPVSLAAIAQRQSILRVRGDERTLVTGITLDSREVRPGDLFAALPGEHTHGRLHLSEAISNGAVACLTDEAGVASANGLPTLVAEHPRAVLGAISAQIYGYPSRELTTVGITGTNGKTTVAHLVGSALRKAQIATGVIGTAGISFDGVAFPAARTTPEAPALHALLARLRDDGAVAVAMEVSSHALELNRVDGVRFDIAAFTNLSQDHLDFHGTMEAYFSAKAKLFTPTFSARAVVAVDDAWGRRLSHEARVPVTTVSLVPEVDADYRCIARTSDVRGRQHLTIRSPDGSTHQVTIAMPAEFNAANALLAWTIAHLLSIDDGLINSAFSSARVPGRMELIDAGQDYSVIVDYAHTPDAVERVLLSLGGTGRVICVLGCGGDRDRAKRPEMGRIAAAYSDLLIITDDNPRGENPDDIRSAMMTEMTAEQRTGVINIGDRREAIGRAISLADTADTVVILGKGHEAGQEIEGVIYPFDDRDEARQYIDNRLAAGGPT